MRGRNGSTRKPASRSARAASFTAARVSRVTGTRPSSSKNPIAFARSSSGLGSLSATGGLTGSSGSWPLRARNSSATSPMVRAMGPMAPRIENGPTHGGRCPRPGIRPGVGLSEQMPVKCAGTRTDPPLSLPKPRRGHPRRNGRRLAAARSARRALQVPWIARAPMQQVRGLVRHQELRAVGRAQNQRSRRAQPRHHHGIFSRNLALVQQAANLAAVTRGRNRRLDGDRQAMQRRRAALASASSCRACARTRSASKSANAFSSGFSRSICRMCASASSVTEIWPVRTSSSCRAAGASTRSFMAAFPVAIAALRSSGGVDGKN